MLRPKGYVDRLVSPVHGGVNHAELKRLHLTPDQIIDFSVSVNPFGPPPGIDAVIRQAAIDRYPDSESTEVREVLARKFGLSADQVIVGSGSTEIIRLIATAYFGIGDLVMIPQPTYSEYETACHLVGARMLKPWMLSAPDFRLNIPRIKELVAEYRPDGLFLCNPNNPTGEYLAREPFNGLLYAAGRSLVIADEAYLAFTDEPWDATELIATGHLVVVRSMTKDFALPGLRLGYAFATRQIISGLNRVKPPWNVSAVAQAAAAHVLGQDAYVAECGQKLRVAREFLAAGLRSRGLLPVPSQANFFLVNVGNAAAFRQALLARGMLVRDCTSFGLPTYIRLAPRSIADCERLLAAIDAVEVGSHAG
jgi:histidinol-phosphate aminotransferase